MPWARLDDGFHDHPKVDGLSLAAVGLYTLCLTWAHRHRKTALVPGHITVARVNKLAGKQTKALTDELVISGLWEIEPHLGGWEIHDFADYLPKERDPDERSAAGKKGAAVRWQKDGKPDGKLPSDSMASDSSRASAPASPTRPVPNPKNEDQDLGGDRPVTLRAVAATEPPDDERCTRHPDGNPRDEPCNGCKRIKERRDRRQEAAADREQRAKEARARVCRRCDGVWVVDDQDRITRQKCDHRAVSA